MPFDRSSHQGSSRRHPRIHPLAWAIAAALAPVAAGALPQDGVVKQGAATIQTPQTGLMLIKQSSQTAAVDWRSFSVGKGETVNILQPNSQALLINRVIGYDPTRILGQINANGRVVLSNPRGVYFSADSQVDVGSLVATTLGISDADLQSGVLRLGASTGGAGELRAEGRIRAADAVALVAPQLAISGSIDARRVGLAAASQVSVDVEGDGLVLFNVRNDDQLQTRLDALGTINATQSAELRAVARAGFADTVLNMEGIVRARSLEGVGGRVVVDGGGQGVTWVNGRIDASGGAGQAGGDVLVQGQRIMLDGHAQLDASGDTGGGRIRVGGDFHGANPDVRNAEMLVARPGAVLSVDAKTLGNGGQVVLWSDESTRFYGTLSARGGAQGGNGGNAEVSGKHNLEFRGGADLRAPRGRTGTLLLDPDNITILTGGSPAVSSLGFGTSGSATVEAGTGASGLGFLLQTTAVVLRANDSITVSNAVDGTGGAGAGTLTLRAGRNINVNSNLTVNGLTLSANDAGGSFQDGTGRVVSTADISAGTGALSISNNGGTGSHSLGGSLSGATISITGPVTLTADAVWTTNSGSSSISGAIGESGGSWKFTKQGAGTLTINALGTYTGDTTVAGGTLAIGGGNDRLPSGSGKGNVIVSSGATLDLAGNNQIVNGLSGLGTVDIGSGTTSTLTVGAGNVTSVFDGVIQNTVSTLALAKIGSGSLTLTGANTYRGKTSIQAGTLSVSSLNNVSGGTASSNLGAPSSTSNGTIDLGGGSTAGTLVYTGSGATTDRVVNLAGTTGGGAIDQSGTGLLKFTSNFTATGNGSKTLTLQRSSGTAAAEIAGVIRDNSGSNRTSLAVASGLWTLSGANTYSGKTSIQGGTLSVASLNSASGGSSNSNLGAPSSVANGTIDLGGGANTGTLLYTGGGETSDRVINLAGTTGGGTIDQSGTGLLKFTSNLTATGAGSKTLTLQRSSGTAVGEIAGAIVDNSGTNTTAVAVGSGAWTLSAASSYSGDTTISGGTLKLNGGDELLPSGSGKGNVIIGSGATLDLAGNSQTVNGLSGLGTVDIGSGTTSTLTVGANNATSTFDGVIRNTTGALALAKTGTGSLTLTGANTYTGKTSIQNGTLSVASLNSVSGGSASSNLGAPTSAANGTIDLGSGATTGTLVYTGSGAITDRVVNLAGSTGGGTLDQSGTGLLKFTSALTATGAGSKTLTLQGSTAGTGEFAGVIVDNSGTNITTLAKAGSGTWALSGTNTYAGGTSINAGTLSITGGAALLDTGAVTLANTAGAKLDVADNETIGALNGGGATGGEVAIANTKTLAVGSGSFAGVISGAGSLAKNTAGTLTLSGANTYSGKTSIQDGTLSVASLNSVSGGGTSSNLGAPTSVANGTIDLGSGATTGTLVYTGSGAITDRVVNLAGSTGGGTIDQSGTDLLKFTSALTATGAGSKTLTLQGSTAGTGEFAGVIVDNGGANLTALVKSGSGSWTLSGANTYTGKTSIQNGTLSVASLNSVSGGAASSNLGAPTSVANGTIDLGSGATTGTLVYTGSGTTTDRVVNLAGSTGGGVIDQSGTGLLKFTSALTATGAGSKTLTLQGSTAGTGEFAGVIVDNSGTNLTTLAKAGSGTWALSGTNTYAGGTSINAGTLSITGGTALLDTGAVTLANTAGAKLDVADNETIGALNGGGTTGGEVAIANTKTLTVASGSFAGVISGAGSLAKNTAGTLVLSGTNTYAGGTSINAGTLSITGGTALLDTGAVTLANTAGAKLDVADNETIGALNGGGTTGGEVAVTSAKTLTVASGSFAGVISGAGSLAKNTAGTLTLSGANTYSGKTGVQDGTLSVASLNSVSGGSASSNLGAPTTAANGTITLGNGSTTGTLVYTGGGETTDRAVNLAGTTGGGVIDQSGTGLLKFTSNFTATGAGNKTLTLQGSTAGTGEIAAAIADNGGANLTALAKSGSGSWTLSGTNTYTGGTIINAGTLSVTGGAALADTGAVTLANTAGATLNVAADETIGALTGGGTTGGNIAIAGTKTLTVASGSFAGVVSGAGSLAKNTAGTLTLSGANTYSGKTSIQDGTLSVASLNSVSGGSASSNLGAPTTAANGTIDLGSGNPNATLVYTGAGETTDRVINLAGNGGVIDHSGTGLLKFTSDLAVSNTGSGQVLRLQGSTAGTGEFAGAIVDGSVSNPTQLQKAGSGSWTISGSNTFTGGTSISNGTLTVSSAAALLDTGSVDVSAGTLNVTDNVAIGLLSGSGSVAIAGTKTLTVASGSFSGAISGAGGLTKNTTGTLTLSGANTYTGKTSIQNGAVSVASINSVSGGSASSNLGAPTTAANGTIDLGSGATSGSLVYTGSGETTDRAVNLAGTTGDATINASGTGLLKFSSALTATGAGSKRLILQGATGGTGEIAGAIVDNSASNRTAVLKLGSTTWTLSGTNTYTGSTLINAGTLSLSGGAAVADNAGTVALNVSGATLNVANSETIGALTGVSGTSVTLAGGQALTVASGNFAGAISGSTGSLVKTGAGTLALTGSNSYGGGTTISGGTLSVSGGAALADAGTVTLANTAGAKLDVTDNETIGALNGGGAAGGEVAIANAKALTVASGNFAGVISGAGALTKNTAGTLTLSGTNTYTGTTTVDGGTLSLSGGAALADTGTVVLANTAGVTLDVAGSETVGALNGGGSTGGNVALASGQTLTVGSGSFAGSLAGAGGLAKTGAGTLTLTGTNTFTGAVDINGGTLSLSNGSALAGTAAVTLANTSGATLDVASSATIAALNGGGASGGNATIAGGQTLTVGSGTFAGALNGAGALAKTGAGTLTLSGTNGYSGGTTLSAGQLTLGANGALGSGALAVNGGTLDIATFTNTVSSLTVQSATVNGTTGVLTAPTQALNNGAIVNANLGTGALTSNGTVALNGTAGATGVTIASGTLTLGSADRLADTAAVGIASGATLKLSGNDTVGSLTTAGTLDKTGASDTLTASTGSYTLNAGAVVNANLGAGTLLSNGSATLNGGSAATTVNVTAGTLTLGAAERLADTAGVTVASGATLKLGGTETVGGINLSGTLDKTAASDTLIATPAGYMLHGGAVVDANLGAGTLSSDGDATLNGNAAATTVNVNGGRLTLGGASLLAAGATVNVGGGAFLKLGGNGTITQLNLSGTLESDVDYTLTATATTGYALTGGVTQLHANLGAGKLSATGTSQLNGTTAATDVSVGAGATLVLGSTAGRLTAHPTISVDVGGTLTLLANNTAQSVSLGAGAQVNGTGTLSATDYVLDNATYNGDLDGGKLTSRNNSTLNGHSAATLLLVDTGSLTLGSGDRFTALPDVTINAGASLTLGGHEHFGSLAGAGTLALGSQTLLTGSTQSTGFSGFITGGPASRLTKEGSATTFTLSGASTGSSGLFEVKEGTLVLSGNNRLGGASSVLVDSGALLRLDGNQTLAAATVAGTVEKTSATDTLNAATYALNDGSIVNANLGSGAVTSNGNVTLNGTAAATSVDIATGTLTLGSADRLGATAAVGIASGATLKLNGSDTVGALASAGTLAGTGATDTLTAASYALNDGAVVAANLGAGALTSNGNVALNGTAGATSVNIATGALTLGAADRLAGSAAVSIANGATLKLNGNDTVGTLAAAGTLAGTGAGDTLSAATYTLNDGAVVTANLGAGALTSNGNAALNGTAAAATVNVATGTLSLGAANRLADTAAVGIASGATLKLNGSDTVGALASAGTLAGTGATDTLTAASYALNDGAVVAANLGAGALTSNGNVALNGTAGASSVNVATGALTLGAADRLAGSAAVSIANGATLKLNGNDTVGTLAAAGTLAGTGAGDTLTAATYALNDGAVVTANLGAGALTSNGNVALNGTAAAATVNVATGTLSLGAANRLADTAAVGIASGATLKLNGSDTVGSLASAGTLAGTGATDTLTAASYALNDGAVVAANLGAGALTSNGNVALNGTAGATSVNVATGALTLGAADRLADTAAVTVASGTTLKLNGSDTVGSFSSTGVLARTGANDTLTAATYALGDGALVNANLGTGVVTSNGNVALNGTAGATTVAIATGTLTLGAADRLAGGAAVTLASGATLKLNGNDSVGSFTSAGLLDKTGGTDTLTAATYVLNDGAVIAANLGAGALTSNGAVTLNGTAGANVTIAAGTLTLGAAERLAGSAAVSIANGATLKLSGNETVGTLTSAGTLANTGAGDTLNAATYALNDGALVNANLGAGMLTSNGNVALNGTAAATTVNVATGVLSLGAANRLADTAAVGIASGATLKLSGNDTVGTLAVAGTLDGTGAADTLSATTTTAANGARLLASLGGGALTTSGAVYVSGNVGAQTLNINGGTLQLDGSNQLGAAPATTLAPGATLALNGSQTLGSLGGAGAVTSSGGTLAVGSRGDSQYDGVYSGAGSLRKEGTGTLILTGNNGYTGTTQIAAGTLQIGADGAGGSLGSGAVDNAGLLRLQRSDAVTLNQPVSGAGSVEQAGTGTLTLATALQTTGTTKVSKGSLVTTGDERIANTSAVVVDAGAQLQLGGNETLGSLTSAGNVALQGNLSSAGDVKVSGILSLTGSSPHTLSVAHLDAQNSANVLGSQPLSLTAQSVQLKTADSAALKLATVSLAADSTISAGTIELTGDVALTGGTTTLVAAAAPAAYAAEAGKQAANAQPLAVAGATISQTGGLIHATSGALALQAKAGGSITLLDGAANDLSGGISAVSGTAGSAWSANSSADQAAAQQSRISLSGDTLRVNGAGIEGDLVVIDAAKLSSAAGSVIRARLPYSPALGFVVQLPGLTLKLRDPAFSQTYSFGAPGDGNALTIDVGSSVAAIPSGFMTILPKKPANLGATAVYANGPATGTNGYQFFYDGARRSTEVPVVYNGVAPSTPEAQGSISATVAVSEGARKDRFEEAVRTENVAIRLRAGVIAEVGAGRPATIGKEGIRLPEGCTPTATLGCEQ